MHVDMDTMSSTAKQVRRQPKDKPASVTCESFFFINWQEQLRWNTKSQNSSFTEQQALLFFPSSFSKVWSES